MGYKKIKLYITLDTYKGLIPQDFRMSDFLISQLAILLLVISVVAAFTKNELTISNRLPGGHTKPLIYQWLTYIVFTLHISYHRT